jgi:hypothetical protein
MTTLHWLAGWLLNHLPPTGKHWSVGNVSTTALPLCIADLKD